LHSFSEKAEEFHPAGFRMATNMVKQDWTKRWHQGSLIALTTQ
jgi:hypothetical protein